MGCLADPPLDVVLLPLIKQYALQICVETGTYDGRSTRLASQMFDEVHTIEINPAFQAGGRANCQEQGCANITFWLGDSRTLLPGLVASLGRQSFFWLDAHVAAPQFGAVDDWPLLDELDIINTSPWVHIIAIDDAHCFDVPRHHAPQRAEIFERAQQGGYGYWRHPYDIIVLAPVSAGSILDRCLRRELE